MSIDAAYFGEEIEAGSLPETQPSAVLTDQGYTGDAFINIYINKIY